MNGDPPVVYKLDHGFGVKGQIRAIKAVSKEAGRLEEMTDILEKAMHLLQTKPHDWGDPEFRAKSVDAVMCHAILRPLAFRFAIYEEARAVVLLSVRLIADFDNVQPP